MITPQEMQKRSTAAQKKKYPNYSAEMRRRVSFAKHVKNAKKKKGKKKLK